jgi:hypothetical protein
VIGTRQNRKRLAGTYQSPTLHELLQLCTDFGLVSEMRTGIGRMKIRCKDEYFDITLREAEILARGLLLGYFAMQTRDDLSLADWRG